MVPEQYQEILVCSKLRSNQIWVFSSYVLYALDTSRSNSQEAAALDFASFIKTVLSDSYRIYGAFFWEKDQLAVITDWKDTIDRSVLEDDLLVDLKFRIDERYCVHLSINDEEVLGLDDTQDFFVFV